MNLIFISPRIIMGGIETLMFRMSRWLIENGHEISILCSSIEDEMYQMFDCSNIIHVHADVFHWHLKSREYIRKVVNKYTGKQIDVLVPYSPGLLKTALAIASTFDTPCRVVAGVWGDTWYINYKKNRMFSAFEDPSGYIFHELLVPGSRLYMNQTAQNRIEDSCGQKVPGVIWPLPVSGDRFMAIDRKPEPGRIISVGRLGGMKEYNIGMIGVIYKLKNDGINVHWDVYGDGKYRELMHEKISSLGLDGVIILHGNVNYADMHKVFENAWLFVGMGTALVEAAYAGVPAVAVVPFHDDPTTFGYFHELPEFNVGEMLDGLPKDFYEIVKTVLCADEETYNSMSKKGMERAVLFDLKSRMHDFMKYVNNIEPVVWSTKMPRIYKISILIYPLLRRIRILKEMIMHIKHRQIQS